MLTWPSALNTSTDEESTKIFSLSSPLWRWSLARCTAGKIGLKSERPAWVRSR